MPKISIIIPVYNAEKYLDECIASVAEQTFSDWELLLVNDGSTDSSRTLCEKWAAKDSRIILLNKENGGIVSALSHGIAHAAGSYCAFMDNDDWYDKDFLSTLYHSVQKRNADIVQVNHRQVGNGFYSESHYPSQILREDHIRNVILPNYTASKYLELSPYRWDKLYRREVLQDIPAFIPPDKVVGEDVLMNFLAAARSSLIVVEDTVPLYNWRYHSTSASRAYSAKVRLQEPLYWDSIEKIAASVDLQHLCKTQENTQKGYIKYIYACGISGWKDADKRKEIRQILSLISDNQLIAQRIRELPASCRSEKIFLTLASHHAIWLALLLVHIVKRTKHLP